MDIESLPDDAILALADLHMPDQQQRELSILLACQREGTLDNTGRLRLEELLGIYRRGMVRKAHALAIAVARGLPPRLNVRN